MIAKLRRSAKIERWTSRRDAAKPRGAGRPGAAGEAPKSLSRPRPSGRREEFPAQCGRTAGRASCNRVLNGMLAHGRLPPRPQHVPDMPAIAGVRLATAAAGIRYKGRTDVLLALFDRAPRWRASSPLEVPVGAGRLVPRQLKARQGARAGGQFRQRQRLHRQDRAARRRRVHRQDRGARPSAAARDVFLASTGVIGEPLDARTVRRRAGRHWRAGRADGWLEAPPRRS